MTACCHCKRVGRIKARVLCAICYAQPGVRPLYPMCPRGYGGGGPVCWACNASPGQSSYITALGWHIRPHKAGNHRFNEVYCPTCFEEFGWPDWSKVPEPESERRDGHVGTLYPVGRAG